MYHSIKNTSENKKLKPPKGWRFSGDPSFLTLTKSNYDTYFMVINRRIDIGMRVHARLMPEETENEWRLEERSKNSSSLIVKISDNLTEIECKKLAIKHARNINRSAVSQKLLWIFIGVLLTILAPKIGSPIIKTISKLFFNEK